MIFESDGEEDFFEINLTKEEFETLQKKACVHMEIPYGIKELHVVVRANL